jgi:Family of unknown function (DUF6093)
VISSSLLDYLRTVADAFLPDTCSIVRGTTTSGSAGVSTVWAPIATGVPCRVSPGGPGSESAGTTEGVMRAVSDWTVWLPALTDVTTRDRVVIVGGDRVDGRTFEVTRVGERSYEAARECLCTLID